MILVILKIKLILKVELINVDNIKKNIISKIKKKYIIKFYL